MTRTFSRCVAILGILSGFPTLACADSLGVASGYNVFVFNGMNRQYTDAEGTVAVGGNANLTGFGINSKNAGGPALVVGGNLTYNGGEVHNGNTVVAGQIFGAVNHPNGTVTAGVGAGGLPFDFSSAVTGLKSRSAGYASLTANGTSTLQYGQLTLTGSAAGTNVFSVNASTFGTLNTFTLNAPTGSTAVVNVVGTAASFQNFSMFLNGVTRNSVLFNFVDATSLTTAGISFQGSILAPYATLSHLNGNIEGTVVVDTIAQGGGEFHWYKFGGSPPPLGEELPPGGGTSPVPAPPAAVLAGVALLCCGLPRRAC